MEVDIRTYLVHRNVHVYTLDNHLIRLYLDIESLSNRQKGIEELENLFFYEASFQQKNPG